jgi:hypothetical protein
MLRSLARRGRYQPVERTDGRTRRTATTTAATPCDGRGRLQSLHAVEVGGKAADTAASGLKMQTTCCG